MNESQCMARLLASAVHDMRNVLAVIRESAGLAQDLASLSGGKAVPAPGAERLSTALGEVQRSVIQGAALSEAMKCHTSRAEDGVCWSGLSRRSTSKNT